MTSVRFKKFNIDTYKPGKSDIKNMKIMDGNNVADKSIKEAILELVTTNDKIFHSN